MLDKETILRMHEKSRGKLETSPKVRIDSKEDLGVYYTPGVAYVSEAIKASKSEVNKYTSKQNTIAIVSDGTRILGLGNIGPEAGLPVMETKALLFKKYGGVDAVPLCISTTDENEIVNFVRHLSPTFGGINIEDIESPKSFRIVDKLTSVLDIPILHDDQHGTAVVTAAALINAMKLAGRDLKNAKIVINGAGSAGLGFVRMFGRMKLSNVYVVDTAGLIYKGRLENMNEFKTELANLTNPEMKSGSLADAIAGADVLIGASTANAFKKEYISAMNEKPIVFALANPVPEIGYSDAKDAGAFIAATGRSDAPNQVNNVLSFPGIMRGLLDAGARKVTYDMLYEAAKALAKSTKTVSQEHILPDASVRKEMQHAIGNVAIAVAEAAVKLGYAQTSIDPKAMKQNLMASIKRYARQEKKL